MLEGTWPVEGLKRRKGRTKSEFEFQCRKRKKSKDSVGLSKKVNWMDLLFKTSLRRWIASWSQPTQHCLFTRVVNELLGKIHLSYSPSQERVRYFSSQKGVTILFSWEGHFCRPKKRGGWNFFFTTRSNKNFSQGRTFLSDQIRRGLGFGIPFHRQDGAMVEIWLNNIFTLCIP